MDAQQWEQLQSLFLAALNREADDRARFLEQACSGDPELRSRVDALLAAHADDRALRIENRLLVDRREPGPEDDGERVVGARIGPFQLLRRIGRGGMGDVYLASRDEPYRQEVAIKVMRLGLQSTELVRRFRAEQQILARLAHPNIARLLDGGVMPDDRPYLAMELVLGDPITLHCDQRRLSIADRLRLFRTVCEAVQFAHGNLIVHRDVKPSNVLVTEHGEVKLLDFGIAKLLDPEGAEPSVGMTQTVGRLMTPEYAAPEQVRGDPITTATDVYALGALLYELLTGRGPHGAVTGSPAEMERIICDEPPEWPSAIVGAERPTRSGTPAVGTPERVSADRGTQPARLRRTLQGDLDNIVMMALRKEPGRRYASAAQLAEDIGRYLDGRPVIARKDTVDYRLGKFVRRNRTTVALAAAMLALVLGSTVALAIQAGALTRERDRVQLEATKATQVASFLANLFEASDPFAAAADRRDTLRVGDFLLEGAEKVRTELSTQPAVQAQLLTVLGSVLHSLGNLEAAQPFLEEGLAVRLEAYGGEHLDVAESQHELALVKKARGEYPEAESLLRQALATRRAILGNQHEDVAESLNALATVVHDQGDLAAAQPLYEDALAMRRALLGTRDLDVATSLNNLSTLYYQQGDYLAADSLAREALALRRDLLGAEHPEVAMTMGQLATVSIGRGDPEEAEGLYREALAILEASLGSDHPGVASMLNNLGGLLRTRGDYTAAEPIYRESLAKWRTIHGDEHPNVALVMHNLAALLEAKGDDAAAEPLYRESLSMRRRLLGDAHPSVAASLNNLGRLLKERGDAEAAAPLLSEAIAINTASLGPAHPRVALTMMTLGELWYEEGRYDQAEPLFIDALAIFRAQSPVDDANVTRATERLHELYGVWGRPEMAAQYTASAVPEQRP